MPNTATLVCTSIEKRKLLVIEVDYDTPNGILNIFTKGVNMTDRDGNSVPIPSDIGLWAIRGIVSLNIPMTAQVVEWMNDNQATLTQNVPAGFYYDMPESKEQSFLSSEYTLTGVATSLRVRSTGVFKALLYVEVV